MASACLSFPRPEDGFKFKEATDD